MKDTLIKFRNMFSEWKIYVSRTTSYINLINGGMLLFLMLSRMKEITGWSFSVQKYYIPLLFISLVFVTFIGWLDTRLGFFRREALRVADRNPYFIGIKKEVSEIKKKVDEIADSLHKSNKVNKETIS